MPDPIARIVRWREEARAAGVKDPEAMALATATPDGVPSVRIVLCRGEDARGLWFFTNYQSRKGAELAANPRASACFYFSPLERQVRVEGIVELLDPADSDAYFATRPRGAQLGAWASPQSRPIGSLDEVHAVADAMASRFEGKDVPRPPFWGGYRLVAHAIEFWEGRPSRLHERERWERDGDGWRLTRLAP